jgi:hypothetical protein
VLTPPKVPSSYYFYFPAENVGPEATYYDKYDEVLEFVGFDAKVVSSLDSIPEESMVIVPWLTGKGAGQQIEPHRFLRRLVCLSQAA